MKWNAWILPAFLGLSLGMVYVLPKVGATAQSAIRMELPGSTGGWDLRQIPASEEEIKILGDETGFSKAQCSRARPGELTFDGKLVPEFLDLSIVLSGSDLNNSIHRPERCMPAQGHNILSSQDVTLDLPNGRKVSVKRLKSVQSLKGARNAERLDFNCLTYYFFVGHDLITNDHLGRTLIDMKDRLVHGRDQRWAYVSCSMWFGKLPWIEKEVTETEADGKLREFLKDFAENQIHWEQIRQ